MRDLGFEEGRSIELIIRSANGNPTALESLAADLIRSEVNIIVAYPTTAGLAAKKATAVLPIVVYGGDLETTGLIANLARPGGNVTGVSGATAELAAKNLDRNEADMPRALEAGRSDENDPKRPLADTRAHLRKGMLWNGPR